MGPLQKLKTSLAVALCFALAACASGFEQSGSELDKMPVAEATAAIAGKTVRTYSNPHAVPIYTTSGYVGTIPAGHGNQVEYFAPNGRAYLWYPGNSRPVPSLWKIERVTQSDGGERNSICFKYPSRSYNPSTKEYGGSWECRFLQMFSYEVVESVEGDPFRLETMRIPFVLKKEYAEIADLLKEAGLPPIEKSQ